MSKMKKKEFSMKKACSIFLIMMLVIGTMLPMAAFADENDAAQPADQGQQQQQDTSGQDQGQTQPQQQDTSGQSQGGQSSQDQGSSSQGSS